MVGTRARKGTSTLLNGLGDQGDVSDADNDNSEAENAASDANSASPSSTMTVAVAVGLPKPAAMVAGTRKGRQPGAKAFKPDEVDTLLNITSRVKPYGSNMWNEVAIGMHAKAKAVGWPIRDPQRYKEKFSKLKNSRKPTGSTSWSPFRCS